MTRQPSNPQAEHPAAFAPRNSANGMSKVEYCDDQATDAATKPTITIFAVPKPFGSETDLIQRNAIRSWARLQPQVEVLLIGNEPGIAEAAADLGVRHSPELEFNESGTPLVSSAFEIARRESSTPYLCYCNSDVILMQDFVRAIRLLDETKTFDQFVAFGQRTDLKVEHEIGFEQPDQIQRLLDHCQSNGRLSSNVCKEYFVFDRELYQNLPPFAIGRGNWDNWMIHSAKKQQLPVVSLSNLVTAIHQAHGYSHSGLGRFRSYVSGDEARENMRLAGGRHLVSGSTATWRLSESGLRRERPLLINPVFWADIPRFTRLLMNLMTG